MKNYIREGKTLTWTNGTGSDVAAGQMVIVGSMLAVAFVSIAQSEEGELSIEGIYELPKNAADVITQGMALTHDVANAVLRDSSYTALAGDVVGSVIAESDAAGTTTTVRVKVGFLGTVTP